MRHGMTALLAFLLLPMILITVEAQKKRSPKQSKQQETQSTIQLAKLRDDYIKATKDYKASLEKLLPLYQKNQSAAEKRFAQSKDLFSQALISKKELDESEHAV